MFKFLSFIATTISILKANIPIAFGFLLLFVDRELFVLFVSIHLAYEFGGQAGYSAARSEIFDVQSQADRALRPAEWIVPDTDREDEPF